MNWLILNFTPVGHSSYFRGYHFGRTLAKRGHDVTYASLSPTSKYRAVVEQKDGIRHVSTPLGPLHKLHMNSYGALDIGHRLKLLFERRWDALVVFDQRPNVAIPFYVARLFRRADVVLADWLDLWGGSLLEAFRGTRMAWTVPLEERWEIDMKRRADGVLAIGRALERRALDAGIPQERVLFLPQGSSIEHPVVDKAKAREAVGLPRDAPIACFMSSGRDYGVNPLLDAMPRILRSVPDAHALFVGPTDEKRHEVAAKRGFADRVHESGFAAGADLQTWLCAADVLVMPLDPDVRNSWYRWPSRLGDFFTSGRPLVASDVGECRWLLREHEIGVLAREDNADFPERVVELLADPARAERLGRNARRLAETEFSWDTLTDRLEGFAARLREARAP